MGSAFRRTFLLTAVPLAAVATLVLVLWLPSRISQQPATPQPIVASTGPAGVPAPLPGSAPAASAAPVGSARVLASARPRVAAARERAVTAAVFEPADATSGIEPLTSITPIEVAPIAEHRVAPAEISVRPLNPVAELQIAPLNPPDGRN